MTGKQKAGKGSTQVSAQRDVVIISQTASVSDIRDIVRAEIELTLSNFKTKALQRYISKGDSMAQKLVAILGDDENSLSAFSDPDFNFAIRDAGRAVASNDGEYTEELLVDILANRAIQGGSNKVKIVTKQAIEAADKLTDVTLNSLSFLWIILNITPIKSTFEMEFGILSAYYGRSLDALKPTKAEEWTEEADLLRLIEIDRSFNASTRPFADFLSERVSRYMRPGIPAERWSDMNALLNEKGFDVRMSLIQHPLKENFVLIDHNSKEEFLEVVKAEVADDVWANEIMEEMATLNNFDVIDDTARERLGQLIDQDINLKRTSEWWQVLPACRITTVGMAIGYLHAKKHIEFNGAQNLDDYLNR